MQPTSLREVPLVSVVVPTRNRPAMLREALASIDGITRDGFEIETIVVDDAPSDDTSHVAHEMKARYVRGSGRGASVARNAGIAAAQGEVIAFLDDDDAWLPGNLAPQMRLLRSHPDFVAVVSRFAVADSRLESQDAPHPRQGLPSGNMLEALLAHMVPPGTIVARTGVVRAIGGFDETLHSVEEWDFVLRLARHGHMGYADILSLLVRAHPEVRSYTASKWEDVSWRRFHDMQYVFRRHTRDLPLPARIRAMRALIKRRGWFVVQFVQYAQDYSREGNWVGVMRSLAFALRISPPHTALCLQRLARSRLFPGSSN